MITQMLNLPALGSNNMSPIQRLPYELLPIIFRKAGVPLLTSHICRGWRTISLDDPFLWAMIHVDHRSSPYKSAVNNPDVLSLYLARSRSVPLSVVYCRCYIPYDDTLEEEEREILLAKCNCLGTLTLLSDHLSRIKQLKIVCVSGFASYDISVILQEAFSKHELPILESLEYWTSDILWDDEVSYYPQVAPALRALRLKNVYIPWSSQLFSNVVELSIDLYEEPSVDDADLRMEVDELFRILRACPQLSRLNLGYCVRVTTPVRITDTTSIDLPLLTEITLEHLPIKVYVIIAQQIVIPSEAKWFIRGVFHPSSLSALSYLGKFSRIVAAKTDEFQLRKVTLYMDDDTVSLCSSRLLGEKDICGTQDDGLIVISMNLYVGYIPSQRRNTRSRTPFFDRVAQIASAMNSRDNVKTFCVEFRSPISSQNSESTLTSKPGIALFGLPTWTKFFCNALPKLELLKLKVLFGGESSEPGVEDVSYHYRKSFMEGILLALTPTMIERREEVISSVDILCPNLQSLEITHLHRDLSGELMHCLSSRATCRAPLRSLKLACTRIPDGWLTEAKQLVEYVSVEEWGSRKDGHEVAADECPWSEWSAVL